jgi:hypothetical protein
VALIALIASLFTIVGGVIAAVRSARRWTRHPANPSPATAEVAPPMTKRIRRKRFGEIAASYRVTSPLDAVDTWRETRATGYGAQVRADMRGRGLTPADYVGGRE